MIYFLCIYGLNYSLTNLSFYNLKYNKKIFINYITKKDVLINPLQGKKKL